MASASGQIARRVGLVIEALSLLGYVATRGEPARGRALMAGLVVGFALWAAGTLAIYWPRPSSRSKTSDGTELEE